MKGYAITSFLLLGSTAALATNILYVDENDDHLKSIDSGSLGVTDIGATGLSGDFGDLAYDQTTNTLYYVGGRNDNALYTINTSTGAATLVGSHNLNDVFGLGADGAGNLYSQDTQGNFYSMNKVNGVATLIGNNGLYTGGLDWDGTNGRMILSIAGGSGETYSVNLATGAATQLAAPGWINDNDITYDPGTGGYFAMDWSGNVYQYDSAFNRTTLGGFGSVTAAIEIVPEPATLAVLGLGALAMIRRRRNR